MARNDEQLLWSTISGHLLSHISAEAMEAALAGFPLPLKGARDASWLASAVRAALAITVHSLADDPASKSPNRATRDDLADMSDLVWRAWQKVFGRNNEADDALAWHGYQQWDGDLESFSARPDSPINRLANALRELEWLATFIGDAARGVEPQKPNWRLSQKREVRLERSAYLAVIFEAAFEAKVSANNYPAGKEQAPTPFMDFLQRMFSLAFGEHRVLDLAGIAKEAARRHRSDPATFGPGIVPGL